METPFLLASRQFFPPHAQGDSINGPSVTSHTALLTSGPEVYTEPGYEPPSIKPLAYPDNNPKTQFGLKKCPLDLVPPALMRGAAEAFQNGADKYGAYNWREKQISSSVYYAATLRHLAAWWDRVDSDDCAPDSHIHHLKHAAACIAMLLDTMGSPLLNDNRPVGVKRDG